MTQHACGPHTDQQSDICSRSRHTHLAAPSSGCHHATTDFSRFSVPVCFECTNARVCAVSRGTASPLHTRDVTVATVENAMGLAVGKMGVGGWERYF